MSAREATSRAMQQITGPVTTLVLAAIFVPVAFLGGITGQLYRQFALTVAISVILSGMHALSLSPALCALILRRPQHNNLGLAVPLQSATRTHTHPLRRRCRMAEPSPGVTVLLFLLVGAGTYVGLMRLPGGFLPEEDQG
jgi:multidrug efflux pump subunit AcrB